MLRWTAVRRTRDITAPNPVATRFVPSSYTLGPRMTVMRDWKDIWPGLLRLPSFALSGELVGFRLSVLQ
jgi:hypothetical protein